MIKYSCNSVLKKGRRFIFSLSIGLFFVISIQGQHSKDDKKIELGIGITDYSRFMMYKGMYGNYQLSAFYRISNSLSVGIQGAYAGFRLSNATTIGGYTTIYAHAISYSLAGKLYFTSLFSERDDRKLHIYAKGKVGAVRYVPVSEVPRIEGTYFGYGAYLGIEYTPFQRAGAFFEIGYGKETFSQFGILFRF